MSARRVKSPLLTLKTITFYLYSSYFLYKQGYLWIALMILEIYKYIENYLTGKKNHATVRQILLYHKELVKELQKEHFPTGKFLLVKIDAYL